MTILSPYCLQLSPRKTILVDVKFLGQHTHSSTAVLLLVAKGGGATSGATLAFKMEGCVTGAKPQVLRVFLYASPQSLQMKQSL